MSLSARVYRSRASLAIDVDALGLARDELTGEFYFAEPNCDGKLPAGTFIACEFWIGNISGVAELREELRNHLDEKESLLLKKGVYSGSHSGDVIELALLPDLNREVRSLLERRKPPISEHLTTFLHGIQELMETAEREGNPIVFV